uniref:Uncharacterized protein n=1 Tax=Rhipicephalus zambeziensis TaxID=60191 RepID=A0A224YHY5_9ACAR
MSVSYQLENYETRIGRTQLPASSSPRRKMFCVYMRTGATSLTARGQFGRRRTAIVYHSDGYTALVRSICVYTYIYIISFKTRTTSNLRVQKEGKKVKCQDWPQGGAS